MYAQYIKFGLVVSANRTKIRTKYNNNDKNPLCIYDNKVIKEDVVTFVLTNKSINTKNMSNISYINPNHNIEQREEFYDFMSEHNLSCVRFEEFSLKSRVKWSEFIDALSKNDTAVLYSFDNAFCNFNDMMFFSKLCSSMNIRIISYKDRLDTKDEMFSESGTERTLNVLCDIFKKRDKSSHDDIDADLMDTSKKRSRLKRHALIINMYQAGWSVKEILKKVGYTSKSNIYSILKKNGIPLASPSKVRNRKKQTPSENKDESTQTE